MKIILNTMPIRPVPTDYPPFASLSLIQELRKAGYDPYFYDIDSLRPSFDEVVRFYRDQKPDLIAISAVVSTAYGYTKRLCRALKEHLPDTPIVLGGNLAASAELLHRFCRVDVCAVGEGEKVIVNLARYIQSSGGTLSPEALARIPGISFLDAKGAMVFTGYESPLTAEEFSDPDYSILERYSKIEQFIGEPLEMPDFSRDPRSYEPRRRGQKMGTVVTAKGCVSRCTFCHRWEKGYRPFSAASVARRIRYLKDRYNVGFFKFSDENFGSNRGNLEELIRELKPLDILFQVGGVRCRSVNPDLLRRLKDAGCVALYYGMETGSPRILEVMEKNTTIQDNLNAAIWSQEEGLYTIYQLVLAMPGENSETIDETIDFVKKVTEDLPERPHRYLSINYIQALPGTPVYEYARRLGQIGPTLKDEDGYLMSVSDLDASDDAKFLNFTDDDGFTVQSWRHRILYESSRHWLKKHGWTDPDYRLPDGSRPKSYDYYTKGGYFNLKAVLSHPIFFRYLYWLRKPYYFAYVITKDALRLPPKRFLAYVMENVIARLRRKPRTTDYRSLRRIVKDITPEPVDLTEHSMAPLRLGR